MVTTKKLHERHNKVALSNLSNGTYFLRVRQGNGVYHAKVIIAE
jgi:hypothetical protein